MSLPSSRQGPSIPDIAIGVFFGLAAWTLFAAVVGAVVVGSLFRDAFDSAEKPAGDGKVDVSSDAPDAPATTDALAHTIEARCTHDQFGYSAYEGTIKNTGAAAAGYRVEVAFRRGGEIVDTRATFVDEVAPGGSGTFDAGSLEKNAECELVAVSGR